MLLVKTKLAYSQIHGIGLYADEDIPKGTAIWKYHPVTCQIFSCENFYELCLEIPIEAMKNFLNFSYIKNNKIFYISDNTRFINHCADANLELISEGEERASRDIYKGEELLENYLMSYDEKDFFRFQKLFDFNTKDEILSELRRVCVND